jgi:4-amino-4-deoxy-L-arabinose transferase-like glycosyltransferase
MRIDAVLALICVASLVVKLGLALWAVDLEPRNDEFTYLRMADAVAQGRFPGELRPPGYPAFLAAIFALGGGSAEVRALQALLSAVSILFVYALARSAADVRTARMAAAITGFDPVLIGFSHLLWTETLYLFLWLGGLALLLTRFDSAARGRFAAAGGVFGLAAFVRPQILSFLPFLLPWIGWRARRVRRLAVAGTLLLAASAAVVLPWSAWQLASRSRLVVVSSTGPFNLLVGTEPTAAFVAKDDHWKSRWGQLPGGGYDPQTALRIGWLRIVSHPLRFAHKAVWEAAHLWTLDSFVLRHLRNGWYADPLPAGLLPAAVVATGAFSAGLMLMGLLGLLAQPASPLRSVAGLAILHSLLLFGLTYSLSRYALPLRPLLACGAAWCATHPGALRPALAASPARRWLAAAALALLGLAWWNDVPLLWDMLAHGGQAFRFSWLD